MRYEKLCSPDCFFDKKLGFWISPFSCNYYLKCLPLKLLLNTNDIGIKPICTTSQLLLH